MTKVENKILPKYISNSDITITKTKKKNLYFPLKAFRKTIYYPCKIGMKAYLEKKFMYFFLKFFTMVFVITFLLIPFVRINK